MKSMTAFASSKGELKGVAVEVKLKSLNSRFLDLKCHMPPSYVDHELMLRKLISTSIHRGKVDLSIIKTQNLKTTNTRVQVDQDLSDKLVSALKQLSKKQGMEAPTLSDVFQVANPVRVIETGLSLKEEGELIRRVCSMALKKLDQQKLREGKSLVKSLKSLLGAMKQDLNQIKKSKEKASKEMKIRLEKKFSKWKSQLEVASGRVEQEIVFYLDKTDIHEEIVRLEEHLRAFQSFLKEGNGKKLDFYTQELLREVNTIGSKVQVVEITAAVVNMKCNIERMREIVQNLE